MKKKESKDSAKKKGKLAALQGLHKMASDMMGADMKGMKKVSVMAKNKEGLEEGLEMAKKLMEEKKKKG